MTKNNTIYLAKITKSRDYEADLTLELEVFSTMDKAMKFMVDNNMDIMKYGTWMSKLNPFEIEGEIIELEVK